MSSEKLFVSYPDDRLMKDMKKFDEAAVMYMGNPFGVKQNALEYGKWLIENCIIAREGFRIGTSNWSEVISNERAYELYLESLKK